MQQSNIIEVFSEEKRDDLSARLTGFWAEDTWPRDELSKVTMVGKKDFEYQFTTGRNRIDVELKVALKFLFEERLLLPYYGGAATMSLICRFISMHVDCDSLVSNPLGKWLFKLRTFLMNEGHSLKHISKNSSGTIRKKTNPIIQYFSLFYRTLYDLYDPRSLLDRPIIDLNKVCPKGCKSSLRKIKMYAFKQDWIRDAFREYIKVRLSRTAIGTLMNHYTHLLRFSRFLDWNYPGIAPLNIDRDVLIAYMDDVSKAVKNGTISQDYGVNAISYLKVFLEKSYKEGFLKVASSGILYRSDVPKRAKPKPRFIPEVVVQNMTKHLHKLPLMWRLVLILLLESGARANELLALPIKCLKKDNDGDYWLERFVSKQSKWHSVPVAIEIVALIKEWGSIISEKYGDHTNFLFPNLTGGRHLSYKSFVNAINDWIGENNIHGLDGNLFHFRTHDCRHTLATRMLDQGLAHHFISDFLGHDSPEITRVYAAIKKAQVQAISNKVHTKRRDKVGGVEIEDFQVTDIDLAKQVRKNVITQRLSNGWCHLSIHQASCISGGDACLDCKDYFETTPEFLPVHRSQRDDELRILQEARAKGHQRQIELTEKKIAKLQAVIVNLESFGTGYYPIEENHVTEGFS